MKHVVFCADDFGQDDSIDAGILRLVERGRLTAVSCLVEGPGFERDAPLLSRRGAAIDVGLHFNLTQGFGGAPGQALGSLVARSHARVLDGRAVERRLADQLDAFERTALRRPDFVDGHQHVHQLPVVRDVLLRVLARRYAASPPFVRNTVPLAFRGGKAFVISCLGGRPLRRALRNRNLLYNPDFAGVYALSPRADYRRLMRGWLGHIEAGGLILCHPGLPGGGDPIAAARAAEFGYLDSPGFEEDCAGAGVVPARRARGGG